MNLKVVITSLIFAALAVAILVVGGAKWPLRLALCGVLLISFLWPALKARSQPWHLRVVEYLKYSPAGFLILLTTSALTINKFEWTWSALGFYPLFLVWLGFLHGLNEALCFLISRGKRRLRTTTQKESRN